MMQFWPCQGSNLGYENGAASKSRVLNHYTTQPTHGSDTHSICIFYISAHWQSTLNQLFQHRAHESEPEECFNSMSPPIV